MSNKPQSRQLVLTREQVRACDRVAGERYGMNSLILMENAGIGAARIILGMLKKPEETLVAIVAGPGNNGGDGYVVARHLANENVAVKVVVCCEREKIKGDALHNLEIIEKINVPITYISGSDPAPVIETIGRHAETAQLIVDALLGTGTAGPPREPIRTAIAAINNVHRPIVALDIPSGLDGDTGEPLEAAVRATCTVSFAALKKGFFTPGANLYTGSVKVVPIGLRTEWLIK